MVLPGGAAGLSKAAGIGATLACGRVLLDVIRAVYADSEGVRRPSDDRRQNLRGYLLTLGRFESSLAALKSPEGRVSLKLAVGNQDRRRLREFLDVVGIRLREANGGFTLERIDDEAAAKRRQWLADAGADLESFEIGLSAGREVAIAVATDIVPLPVSARVWSEAVFTRPVTERALAGAILSDRNAALLYYGLAALDPPTLAHLTANPALVARLYQDHAAVFATCGRSLHVRDARVETPGPALATPLWEKLVGVPTDQPDRFIRNVLGRDDGRLAQFYDMVAHLNGPGQRYALGTRIENQERQQDELEALYLAFAAELQPWSPIDRPFVRIPFDAAQLLSEIIVTPDGALAPPAWRHLWTTVFADPALPDRETVPAAVDIGGPVAASALVAISGGINVNVRRDRMETILFAQRVFGSADASALPEIFIALRGFIRYRALLLTLERIGISSPPLLARAARHAARLSAIGDQETRAVALAEFQGALAIVERARFARVVDVSAATGLVDSLLDAGPTGRGDYAGGMARWLEQRLLPALSNGTRTPLTDTNRETVVLMALAGARTSESPAAGGAPEVVVRWEDQDYRVDLAATEMKRLERLRAKQSSNGLDAALDFASAAARLSSTPQTMEKLRDATAALREAVAKVQPPLRIGFPQAKALPDPSSVADRALREAAKIKTAGDLPNLARIASPLVESGDMLLSEVLATLAYLPSLGDPEGATMLAGNVAALHDFEFGEVRDEARVRIPWRIATERTGAGVPWHLAGSLLGLDVALSYLALRPAAGEHAARVPALDWNERATLADAVVLRNPRELMAADLDLIKRSIRASRERLSARSSDLGQWLAEAGVDEWRVRALEWTATHEPDQVAGLLSLVDLFWLSAGAAGRGAKLDGFGPSAASVSGCLCTRFPPPQPWDTATGREGAGFLMSRFADLTLRMAEGLADLGLPPSLLPSVLAVATPEFLGEADPAHRDDWVTLAQQAQGIPRSRIEDYVATLTALGPLIPVNSRN